MDAQIETVLKNCGYKPDKAFDGDYVLHLKDTPAFLCPPGPEVNCYCEERVEIMLNDDGTFNLGLVSIDPEILPVVLLGARLDEIPMFTVAAANVTAMGGVFTSLYEMDGTEINNPYADIQYGDWIGEGGPEGPFILKHPTAPEYDRAAKELLQKVENYSPELYFASLDNDHDDAHTP